MLDAQQRQADRADGLRLALISHDPEKWLRVFFPELAVEEVEAEEDLEDTTGEWRFEEQVAPEEAEAILSRMLADPSGTLTGEEAMEGGWR